MSAPSGVRVEEHRFVVGRMAGCMDDLCKKGKGRMRRLPLGPSGRSENQPSGKEGGLKKRERQ